VDFLRSQGIFRILKQDASDYEKYQEEHEEQIKPGINELLFNPNPYFLDALQLTDGNMKDAEHYYKEIDYLEFYELLSVKLAFQYKPLNLKKER
jgi:hypothetical protein